MQHSKAIVLVPHVRRGRKFRADNLFIQASIGNKTVEEDDLSPVYAMFIISLVRKKNPYHPFHRAHLEHSNWRPGQSSYVNKYPLLRQRADLSQ
jgi:hypothetical protein